MWLKDCVEKHAIVNCLNRSGIFKSLQLKTKSTISLVLRALWFFPPWADTRINASSSEAAELKAQLLRNVNKYVGQAELVEPDGL